MRHRKRLDRPTTIDGLTNYRRPNEIGRIKIGEKVGGCKKCKNEWPLDNGDEKLKCPSCGNTNTSDKDTRVYTRPAKLDWFKIVPDDESLIPLINELYGPKPTAVDIKLPVFIPTTSDEPDPEVDLDRVRDMTFPQSYTWFVKSGLNCTGDGVRAIRYTESPDGKEIECNPDKCEVYGRGDCSESARLYVYLYRLPTFGVFKLSTRSVNSIIDINTAIDSVFAIAEMIAEGNPGNSLAKILPQIPLRLRVKQASGRDDKGNKTVFNKLSIDLGTGIIPYLASQELMLGPARQALPAKTEGDEEIAEYVDTDPDERRHELIMEIKGSPPYKLDKDAFPDGKIDYEKVARFAAEAADFTETVIGRREKSLDKLTTPELEKIVEAIKLYEPDEPDGMYTPEDAGDSDIQKAEAIALIELIKKLEFNQAEVARLANDCLKPDEEYKRISPENIEGWNVDTITIFFDYLTETFKDILK